MAKQYEAIFRIWDASSGEKNANLLEESEIYTFSPLSTVHDHWTAFCENCPVELEPISERALRVSMTRNYGVGVQRRRFVFEGAPYLVTIHAAEVRHGWSAPAAGGMIASVEIVDDEIKAYGGNGEQIELIKTKIPQLTLPTE